LIEPKIAPFDQLTLEPLH